MFRKARILRAFFVFIPFVFPWHGKQFLTPLRRGFLCPEGKMQSNYDQSLHWVLQHEGGFSDHKADPGGATNKGITQKTYDAYRADARNLGE